MRLLQSPFLSLLVLLCLQSACIRGDEEDEEIGPKDPDFDRRIPQLIESRGFISEQHYVTTADGYILSIYRIVNPLLAKVGRPVILQHGLMSSGHDFLINSPGGDVDEDLKGMVGNNLGFELSKRGYDVWLANSRGNYYSRNHTFLHPDMGKTYWDFTYDHMIQHDLPSTIDYVIKVTERKTLAYVGHSQGTLLMFGLLSEQAAYNEIVKPFVALAPVATVGNTATPFKHLARIPFINSILERIGGEFMPNGRFVKSIAEKLCTSKIKAICRNIMFMANGFSETQLNRTRVHVYASHYPAGTSTKNIAHYAQGVKGGKFAKYDFGARKNRDMYDSESPPEYKLEKISNKDIILFSSENDWLASPADVNVLVRKLHGTLMMDYKIPVKTWNHLDFLIGRDAGLLVNRKILEIFHRYDNRE